jgi:hypothetical protein
MLLFREKIFRTHLKNAFWSPTFGGIDASFLNQNPIFEIGSSDLPKFSLH